MAHPATKFDIELFGGANDAVDFEVRNASDATFDPTGYTFAFKATRASDGAVTTISPTFPTPSISKARVTFTTAQTRSFAGRRAATYTLQVTSPGGGQEISHYGYISGLDGPNDD